MRRDDIGEKKKINRYRPPAKGTRIRYSHIRCEFPAGTRRRPSKNNFQLPRARDKRAHARARMIRRVGLLPLPLLVPRCLFLFFRPLCRHPSPPPHASSPLPPPLPSKRTTLSAGCTARRAAPRRAGRSFVFLYFPVFPGGPRRGHTAANRWCAAQQVADYKNHSTAPRAC